MKYVLSFIMGALVGMGVLYGIVHFLPTQTPKEPVLTISSYAPRASPEYSSHLSGLPHQRSLSLPGASDLSSRNLFSWLMQDPWNSWLRSMLPSSTRVLGVDTDSSPFEGFESYMRFHLAVLRWYLRHRKQNFWDMDEPRRIEQRMEQSLLEILMAHEVQTLFSKIPWTHDRFRPVLIQSKPFWNVLLQNLFPSLPPSIHNALLARFRPFNISLLHRPMGENYISYVNQYLSVLNILQEIKDPSLQGRLLYVFDLIYLTEIYLRHAVIEQLPAILFQSPLSNESREKIKIYLQDNLQNTYHFSPKQLQGLRPYLSIFVEKLLQSSSEANEDDAEEKTGRNDSILFSKEKELKRLSAQLQTNRVMEDVIWQHLLTPEQKNRKPSMHYFIW